MNHRPRSSGEIASDAPSFADADAGPLPAGRRAAGERLPRETAEETAALRREAAELLGRSRWWRDEQRRELLRERRWHARGAPVAGLGPDQDGRRPA